MKHTIEDLKKVWQDTGVDLQPCTKAEIEQTVKKLGPLPEVLVEYYKKIGMIKSKLPLKFIINMPDHLVVTQDGEDNGNKYMIIANEMQGVCDFGIALEDVTQQNPVVYCSGEPYYNIAKQTDCEYIPGNHPDLETDSSMDTRTLMNLLWSFAAAQTGSGWVFEDDDIYGYSDMEREMRGSRQAVQKTAYEQQIDLKNLLRGKPVENPSDDYSLVKELCVNCALKSELGKAPVPGPCYNFNLLVKAPNITHLEITAAIISDSIPLASLKKLKNLEINHCRIDDFSFLKDLNVLKEMSITYTPISQPELLGTPKKLKEIYIKGVEMPVLPLMKGIKDITLYGVHLQNISALAGMKKLEYFFADIGKVADLSSLLGLAKLKTFILTDNQVTDVSPLETLSSLDYINLSGNPVSDITSFKYITNLTNLQLNGTQVEDITPLMGLPKLQMLALNRTRVQDITPLQTCKSLTELHIAHTGVTDVSTFLKRNHYKKLDLRGLLLPKLENLAEGANLYFPWMGENNSWLTWQGYHRFLSHLFWRQYRDAADKTLLAPYLPDVYALEKVEYYNFIFEDNTHFQYKHLVYIKLEHVQFNYTDIQLPQTLEWVSLEGDKFCPVDMLQNLPNLKVLQLTNCNLKDFDFLKRLPGLQLVQIKQDTIEDIASLKAVLASCSLLQVHIKSNSIPEREYSTGAQHQMRIENGHLTIEKVQ